MTGELAEGPPHEFIADPTLTDACGYEWRGLPCGYSRAEHEGAWPRGELLRLDAALLPYRIAAELRARYGPAGSGGPLPAGLRLELHPEARYALLLSEDLFRHPALLPSGDLPVQQLFRVPMRVNPDLPARSWRLVIVNEEELAAGRLH